MNLLCMQMKSDVSIITHVKHEMFNFYFILVNYKFKIEFGLLGKF